MPRLHREIFLENHQVLPELVMLGHNHNTRARVPGLHAHTHFHAFEIFYLERGEVEWWTGSETHHVAAGQIYINRPGERHGSVGAALQPCSYFWLQLKANRPHFLPGLPVADSRAIARVLQEAAPRCFAVSAEIARYFQLLIDETRCSGPLSAVVARANLHLLLAQIARDAQAQNHPTHSPAMAKTLRFLAENLENEICPAQLAARAGLSLGHFRERFRAETGFTPHAYLTRQRIEAAKLLLAEDVTVTEIARRFGFCSSQHFATVFKKLEGVSPSDFGRINAGANVNV
jgi:AraC-like DNA-binding protein